jgi:PhzF family phenazine biosynthesis protein
MAIPLIHVDAFTDRPFAGNPAAVCLLERPVLSTWMQQVAAEMNLSETAFLLPRADGFALRWFTPAVEVELCGHATLAGAHVLWERGVVERHEPIRFFTRSKLLRATRQDDWIWLDFPARQQAPAGAPEGLIQALGVTPVYVGAEGKDYLVEMASEALVRHLRPDFALLRRLPVRELTVTSQAEAQEPYDFVSRFFAPAYGIDEDPVTGIAHCMLAPFWGARLGKTECVGYQASVRGGVVRTRLEGDRVHLGGHAVTVARGEILRQDGAGVDEPQRATGS